MTLRIGNLIRQSINTDHDDTGALAARRKLLSIKNVLETIATNRSTLVKTKTAPRIY